MFLDPISQRSQRAPRADKQVTVSSHRQVGPRTPVVRLGVESYPRLARYDRSFRRCRSTRIRLPRTKSRIRVMKPWIVAVLSAFPSVVTRSQCERRRGGERFQEQYDTIHETSQIDCNLNLDEAEWQIDMVCNYDTMTGLWLQQSGLKPSCSDLTTAIKSVAGP